MYENDDLIYKPKEKNVQANLPDESRIFTSSSAPFDFPGYDSLARSYANTGEEKYYEWLLHFAEDSMTAHCKKLMKQNNLTDGLSDLKTAYAFGLFKALREFDPSVGTKFMTFASIYVRNELDKTLCSLIPGYSIGTVGEYRRMKRVMALYEARIGESFDEVMKEIAEEIHLSVKKTTEIFLAAARNSHPEPLTKTMADEPDAIEEEYIPSPIPSPEKQLMLDLRAEALWGSFEKLPLLERMMIAEECGFCVNCYGIFELADDKNGNKVLRSRKPMTRADIAAKHQLSPRTVSSKLNKAYATLREYLHETDYFAGTVFDVITTIQTDRKENDLAEAV